MSDVASRLERLEDKLDNLANHLMKQAVLHERNTVSLEEHIRRTRLAEERMGVIEDNHEAFEKKTAKQMDVALLPIKAVKWLAAFVIGAAAVISAVKGLMP